MSEEGRQIVECEFCGFNVNDCACDDDEWDELPICHDCGAELDPNGFCDECDGDPWG